MKKLVKLVAASVCGVVILGSGITAAIAATSSDHTDEGNGFYVNTLRKAGWFPSSTGEIQSVGIDCDNANDTVVGGGVMVWAPSITEQKDHVKVLYQAPSFDNPAALGKDGYRAAVWSNSGSEETSYDLYAICYDGSA